MFIPDPDFFPIPDPDPGVKKKSPGSRIRCCHVPPKPESNVCVGQERRVEVANVWRGIHVEYGRGDETRGRRVGIHPASLLA
jgi:hypothetical protein